MRDYTPSPIKKRQRNVTQTQDKLYFLHKKSTKYYYALNCFILYSKALALQNQ